MNDLYETNYPLPDPGDPPTDEREMVRQIMEEGLFSPGNFTSWTWEKTTWGWLLRTFPTDPQHPASNLISLREIYDESDPAKALIMAWRWRGRKKGTMRDFFALLSDMKTHELKTHPEPFEEVLRGRKTFEYRKDDRGYKVGDALVLHEWNPTLGMYTGRATKRQVTSILRGPDFGVAEGFCVMSLSSENIAPLGEFATRGLVEEPPPQKPLHVVTGVLVLPHVENIRERPGPPFGVPMPAFLLGRRRGKDFHECWEFPGGKVEEGETLVQALTREWREELELTAHVGPKVGTFGFVTPEGHSLGAGVPYDVTGYFVRVDEDVNAADWAAGGKAHVSLAPFPLYTFKPGGGPEVANCTPATRPIFLKAREMLLRRMGVNTTITHVTDSL